MVSGSPLDVRGALCQQPSLLRARARLNGRGSAQVGRVVTQSAPCLLMGMTAMVLEMSNEVPKLFKSLCHTCNSSRWSVPTALTCTRARAFERSRSMVAGGGSGTTLPVDGDGCNGVGDVE